MEMDTPEVGIVQNRILWILQEFLVPGCHHTKEQQVIVWVCWPELDPKKFGIWKGAAAKKGPEQRLEPGAAEGQRQKNIRGTFPGCSKGWAGGKAWIAQSWRPEISVKSAKSRKLTTKVQLCCAISHWSLLSPLPPRAHYQVEDKKQSLRKKDKMPPVGSRRRRRNCKCWFALPCKVSIAGRRGSQAGWRAQKCRRKRGQVSAVSNIHSNTLQSRFWLFYLPKPR